MFERKGEDEMTWRGTNDGTGDDVGGMFEDVCDHHCSRETREFCRARGG